MTGCTGCAFAVPRTVQAKLNDYYDVKDFGATGNGVTDDSAAIQAAINCCSANGGGMVYMPSGTYLVGMGTNTAINMASNVSLVGSGIGATTISRPPAIEADQSNIVFNVIGCTNAQFRDINFYTTVPDPTYTTTYRQTIANTEDLPWEALDTAHLFVMSSGCTVRNCSYTGFRTPISLRGTALTVTTVDNTFEDLEFNNFVLGILYNNQERLLINNIRGINYYTPDVDPHVIYGTGSSYEGQHYNAFSIDVTISNLMAENSYYGEPIKVRYGQNVNVSNVMVNNCPGLITITISTNVCLNNLTGYIAFAPLDEDIPRSSIVSASILINNSTNVSVTNFNLDIDETNIPLVAASDPQYYAIWVDSALQNEVPMTCSNVTISSGTINFLTNPSQTVNRPIIFMNGTYPDYPLQTVSFSDMNIVLDNAAATGLASTGQSVFGSNVSIDTTIRNIRWQTSFSQPALLLAYDGSKPNTFTQNCVLDVNLTECNTTGSSNGMPPSTVITDLFQVDGGTTGLTNGDNSVIFVQNPYNPAPMVFPASSINSWVYTSLQTSNTGSGTINTLANSIPGLTLNLISQFNGTIVQDENIGGGNIDLGGNNIVLNAGKAIFLTSIATNPTGSTYKWVATEPSIVYANDAQCNLSVGDNTNLITRTNCTGATAIGENALQNNTASFNTAVGCSALQNNTTGLRNTTVGFQAGLSNINGSNNVFVGQAAGQSNTTSNNTFIGTNAGQNNTTGNLNVMVGFDAGNAQITDTHNTYIGYQAGANASGGSNNVFIGYESGLNNTASDNTFLGYEAGENNTSGTENVFVGFTAGKTQVADSQNVFIGYQAGLVNSGASDNTFIGYNAGVANTTGNNNVFVGKAAGTDNTTGTENTFVGSNAGEFNTTAGNNTFIGFAAGEDNTTGTQNVFVGRAAGSDNTTANQNTFVGADAGQFNTTGSLNTFLGYFAGQSNTIGAQNVIVGPGGTMQIADNNNVFIGYHAGQNASGGSNNVFIGSGAGEVNAANENVFIGVGTGESNTTGAANTYIGYQAGQGNTTGTLNVFLGLSAGSANTTGVQNVMIGAGTGTMQIADSNNVFIGYHAGQNASGGSNNVFIGLGAGDVNAASYNVFIGDQAGLANQIGTQNVFIGYFTGTTQLTDNNNTFIGYSSGTNNSGASDNTFIGNQTGQKNTTGNQNVFIGSLAGNSNTIGAQNAFEGYQSGTANTTGSANTFMGWNSGMTNTVGSNNTFIGNAAGMSNLKATDNTFIGNNAGMTQANINAVGNTFVGSNSGTVNTTGNANTCIGFNANLTGGGGGLFNATALGANAIVGLPNSIQLGNSAIQNLYCAVALTVTSDARSKRDIDECALGLEFVNALKPVQYKPHNDDRVAYGLIAQDVEKLMSEFRCGNVGCVENRMPDGGYGLRYNDLIAILIKGMQELSVENKELRTLITQLQASL